MLIILQNDTIRIHVPEKMMPAMMQALNHMKKTTSNKNYARSCTPTFLCLYMYEV